MTVKAKCILKDKFWIVEQDNERIGTLSCGTKIDMYSLTQTKHHFSIIKMI